MDDRETATLQRISLSSRVAALTALDKIKEADTSEIVTLPSDVFRPLELLYLRVGNEHINKIINAATWHFESHIHSDGLLGFILQVTATEALLGTKKSKENVTMVLASSCAFLIGRGGAERDQIIKDFKEIYDTRSNILHRGARELSLEESIQQAKLNHYLTRCLQVEIGKVVNYFEKKRTRQ